MNLASNIEHGLKEGDKIVRVILRVMGGVGCWPETSTNSIRQKPWTSTRWCLI